jgi:hypothetical protein
MLSQERATRHILWVQWRTKMQKLFIALSIGLAAGILDVIPMLLKKAPLNAWLVPMVHWVIVGVLIAYAKMPLPNWATGLIVALLTTLPTLITYSQTKPQSVLPIAIVSIVFGAIIGVANQRFNDQI